MAGVLHACIPLPLPPCRPPTAAAVTVDLTRSSAGSFTGSLTGSFAGSFTGFFFLPPLQAALDHVQLDMPQFELALEGLRKLEQVRAELSHG